MHMCEWHMYLLLWVFACVPVCSCMRRTEVHAGCFPQLLSTFVFKTYSLTEPEAYQLLRWAGPEALQIPQMCPHSITLGLEEVMRSAQAGHVVGLEMQTKEFGMRQITKFSHIFCFTLSIFCHENEITPERKYNYSMNRQQLHGDNTPQNMCYKTLHLLPMKMPPQQWIISL